MGDGFILQRGACEVETRTVYHACALSEAEKWIMEHGNAESAKNGR